MAMVDEKTCASCDFNVDAEQCQRVMVWTWRGRHFTASPSEVQHQKNRLSLESFPNDLDGKMTSFNELGREQKAAILTKSVKEISLKV